ncbi:MAG: Ig-like domain-containing protein [Archangiaceae bacterium]|nr:Ig-like domain-containing protein [Archangiaceae bacterium]
MLRNSTFQLNAQRSSGNRPLIFNWSQDAGLPATFQQNNSINAATPTITAPGNVSLLKLNLSVRDMAGRDSETASVFVPVAIGPPLAAITGTPTAPVLGGQRVVLSGATSSDPNTSGLISWEWTVSPPGLVTATPINGGQQLQLDMPASVATPVVVSVQLVVTNGLTMRSAPATATFQLALGALPQWYVDAGAAQTVNGGDIVTLAGRAFAPSTGAVFSYAWSPEREPDGGVADFQLTDASSPVTTFVAPRVDGPVPRLISFTLTATDTAATLTPAVSSAQTFVNVLDRRAPILLGTSISAGQGPMSTAWVDFDEEVNPASLNGVSIGAAPSSGAPFASAAAKTVVGKRRVVVTIRPPLAPGFLYTFGISGVRDMAGNTITPASYVFLARNSWGPAQESTSTALADPWPGVAYSESTGLAWVFARRDGTPWFFSPFDPLACTAAPCSLADDPTAPVFSLTGPMPRGHKGWVVGGEPVATLQVATLQGAPASVLRRADGGWAAIPAPPSSVFGDGTWLHSVKFDDGGVTHVVLDGGAWVSSSVITTNLTEYPTDSLADPFAFGNASLGARPMVVLKSSRTDTMRSAINDPPWAGLVNPGNGVEARVGTMMPEYPNSAFVFVHRPTNTLDLIIHGSVGNAAFNIVSGLTSFDVLSNASSVWFATAAAGQVELRYVSFGAGATSVRLIGPVRAGVPGFSLNNDVACEAARPELGMANGRVVVVWQERCAGGQWHVYARALE